MMRLAWLALAMSASLVLDCSPVAGSPTTTSPAGEPSATERLVSASPTSTSQVAGSPVVASSTPAPAPSRSPITGLGNDARVEVAGCQFPACLHWAIAAGRQVALVSTLRHRTETEFDSDLTVVDLTTGAQRLIRHGAAALVPGRIGGPLLTYVESEPAPGGTFRMTWRAYERDWRAGTERLLDETTAEVSPTGGWAPSPSPLTNGTQTVWLRSVKVSGQADRYELLLSDRGAPGRAIYTASNRFYFELDDRGRVAIGTVGSNAAELLLYESGVVRSLARRQRDASSDGGWVGFSGGKIVWSFGWGFPGGLNGSSVDLIDPATGVAKRLERSPCSYAGSTPRYVAFACSDGGDLYDSVNGNFTRFATYAPGTFGPDSFGLHASPEALWLPELREPAGRPNNSVRFWMVTPVVP